MSRRTAASGVNAEGLLMVDSCQQYGHPSFWGRCAEGSERLKEQQRRSRSHMPAIYLMTSIPTGPGTSLYQVGIKREAPALLFNVHTATSPAGHRPACCWEDMGKFQNIMSC